MVAKVFKSVSEVIGSYSGLSRIVLEYVETSKKLSDECKKPGFDSASWDRLFTRFFDKENFRRVGHLKEEMDYPTYIGFQTKWATHCEWDCSFKRISEHGNVVFLELEERANINGFLNAVNTVSVYEFTDKNTVRYLDVYLQQAPLPTDAVPEPYK